jgi:hypothetical protein
MRKGKLLLGIWRMKFQKYEMDDKHDSDWNWSTNESLYKFQLLMKKLEIQPII